ncbi:MAG: bifunctional folylpolyglutamate synthase/dihydrofolate synthase [Clostridiales bacterium]|nr:bifunctional folylpolyglutamate synthase/dihydrofolate synthase [Clostridiales bacterium]
MNYEEAISYIHSLSKFGIKPGLERITALCRALGDPQDSIPFIHVAGTNGKGSTSTMISNIFRSANYKTGLFISPYVTDFRERIQINGEMISESDLAFETEKVKRIADKMCENGEPPTEFEFITALAFDFFKNSGCDIAVLEVGLGGRLDSTNVIKTPLAGVITSVSLDHMAVLGDTVEKIAYEKCGIIKDGGITVCYPKQDGEALSVIRKTAEEKNNLLVIPPIDGIEILKSDLSGSDAVIDGIKMHVPFLGEHMVYNAAAAVFAAKAVRDDKRNIFYVSDNDIKKGVESSAMPARMEIISEKPLTVLDGGHNADCAEALKNAVKEYLGGKRITAVCGMMADKECEKYLSKTAPLFEKVITVTPDVPRAIGAKELASLAEKYCKNVCVAESFDEAAKEAVLSAGDDGTVIICGSFYMAADMKKAFSTAVSAS